MVEGSQRQLSWAAPTGGWVKAVISGGAATGTDPTFACG
jgi:hypothetical protein